VSRMEKALSRIWNRKQVKRRMKRAILYRMKPWRNKGSYAWGTMDLDLENFCEDSPIANSAVKLLKVEKAGRE